MKIIDKTYLTKSGRDIRDSKMPGTFEVNISEKNEEIAERRIELAEKINKSINLNLYAKKQIKIKSKF